MMAASKKMADALNNALERLEQIDISSDGRYSSKFTVENIIETLLSAGYTTD